jgi:hypothetical protein
VPLLHQRNHEISYPPSVEFAMFLSGKALQCFHNYYFFGGGFGEIASVQPAFLGLPVFSEG